MGHTSTQRPDAEEVLEKLLAATNVSLRVTSAILTEASKHLSRSSPIMFPRVKFW